MRPVPQSAAKAAEMLSGSPLAARRSSRVGRHRQEVMEPRPVAAAERPSEILRPSAMERRAGRTSVVAHNGSLLLPAA